MKNRNRFFALFLALCMMQGVTAYAARGTQDAPASSAQSAAVQDASAAAAAPVSAAQIANGTYELTNIQSSSSMFKIVRCELTVADGEMNAVITMSGDGYGKVFVGTGEEAAAAAEDAHILAAADSEGAVTFTVPLEELNAEMDLAAWSIKKEKWYDRTVTFFTDGIPAEAIAAE